MIRIKMHQPEAFRFFVQEPVVFVNDLAICRISHFHGIFGAKVHAIFLHVQQIQVCAALHRPELVQQAELPFPDGNFLAREKCLYRIAHCWSYLFRFPPIVFVQHWICGTELLDIFQNFLPAVFLMDHHFFQVVLNFLIILPFLQFFLVHFVGLISPIPRVKRHRREKKGGCHSPRDPRCHAVLRRISNLSCFFLFMAGIAW